MTEVNNGNVLNCKSEKKDLITVIIIICECVYEVVNEPIVYPDCANRLGAMEIYGK